MHTLHLSLLFLLQAQPAPAAQACTNDQNCCPGQKCDRSTDLCAEPRSSCSVSANCTIPGQSCVIYSGQPTCAYQACVVNADCVLGQTCMSARCVLEAPCDSGCPLGQACAVDANICFRHPNCAQTCPEGQTLVLAQSNEPADGSQVCSQVACTCARNPPIKAGEYGYYAAMALRRNEVVISAYDQTYGDLVLAHFDLDGTPGAVEYIDGFPDSGPISGDPDGPRGGRTGLGPDVGLYTSIAVDTDDFVHIAYYDRTFGQLKYATNTGGHWAVSVVDNQGQVGLYTSLALGTDGRPRIAYMLQNAEINGSQVSGLKYAKAHSESPSAPSDWDTFLVDSEPVPSAPCGGSCPARQACIATSTGSACRDVQTGCVPSCAANQVCAFSPDPGEGLACQTPLANVPVDDLIPGTGLFSSLLLQGSNLPVVAYYDRITRSLRWATGDNSGHFLIHTLEDEADDVGQHVRLAPNQVGAIGMTYQDVTRDQLLYLEISSGTISAPEIVDNGIAPGNIRIVGADAALLFDPSGQPAIAYQDSSNLDLCYARRLSGRFQTQVIHGGENGQMSMPLAGGFYATQARRGNLAYIASTDVTFDRTGNLILRLNLQIQDLSALGDLR